MEIEEPLAEIILKTNSARGPGEFRFICNKNQLQVQLIPSFNGNSILILGFSLEGKGGTKFC